MNRLLPVIFLLFIITSCNQPEENSGDKVFVATTGMIGDALKNISPPGTEIRVLMGPGVDPHLFKASQNDLKTLRKGSMIFYNGLHLEGKMGEILEKLGRQKPVVAVAGNIEEQELLAPENYPENYDPHVWFDVELWSKAVENSAMAIIRQYPSDSAQVKKNLEEYKSKLGELHRWTKKEISTIPRKQRVLVTAHDAFSYFGKAYDIEVIGLQGISTLSEYGIRDITNMTSFISERGVKAVFVESSVSDKALKSVVEGCREKGHKVRIGGTLYSDAMGEEGTDEGTYIGMVRYNVNTIVKALR